jgi:hypothetical protein
MLKDFLEELADCIFRVYVVKALETVVSKPFPNVGKYMLVDAVLYPKIIESPTKILTAIYQSNC